MLRCKKLQIKILQKQSSGCLQKRASKMAHKRLVTAINENRIDGDSNRSQHILIAAKKSLDGSGCRLSDGKKEYHINSTQRVTDINGKFSSNCQKYNEGKHLDLSYVLVFIHLNFSNEILQVRITNFSDLVDRHAS